VLGFDSGAAPTCNEMRNESVDMQPASASWLLAGLVYSSFLWDTDTADMPLYLIDFYLILS